MSRAHKALLRGLLGLGLLLGVVVLADLSQLWQRLRQAQPLWLLAGLALALASNIVSALRWRALVQWLGAKMPCRSALRWYFQAMGLNALLPGAVVGGDVYRAVALRQSGEGAMAASASVVLDRLSGVWMLCVLGALGALASAPVLAPWAGVPAWALAGLAGLAAGLGLVLPWAGMRHLRRRKAPPHRWLAALHTLANQPDTGQRLLRQALASMAVQVLSAAALAAGAWALGVQAPWSAWAFAMAPIFLLAALPVSVGGWGTREAAAVLALAPFGVDAAGAVGAALVYGLYGLVQGGAGALAFGLGATRDNHP
ncbi:lysylphosphatidylglycerol synthase transmembrane domain-containing protein [Acidovorax sp. FHTAMBA]|jgi:uncharacterized membrane protein YbhN (UPF0104 family)|uniref:lysylphosphatidylglycerol synthase transmembrane domain-containing protein n=1 Tax=Acidovorax sp. FHTAMBA TaxID=3140252 RepID=UPI0015F4337B